MNDIQQYLEEVQQALTSLPEGAISEVIDVLLSANYVGSTVYTMGNGGSASTASHFACDLAKGTITPGRPRFRVVALTDSLPQITAWSNDVAYEDVFAEQLSALVARGDVAVAFSGSGNSPNVLRAVDLAHQAGGITVGFSGFDGGQLCRRVDVPVVVNSSSMAQIEDVHMTLCHLITTALRARLQKIKPPLSLMLDTAPWRIGRSSESVPANPKEHGDLSQ